MTYPYSRLRHRFAKGCRGPGRRYGGHGRRIRHAPDYFVRRRDGTAVVVDVRPDERIKSGDTAKFSATPRPWPRSSPTGTPHLPRPTQL
ncbi:hypothetical protein C1J00_26020 [Streptomyces cahuitamycinicus]|uniref:Uncharacterized protein n=1 Tax=Streptomyces cahuitamycinicus TaxID=2070367 RepID=A0A2N8TK31_9ACTN|nr:hypothetical protein C1J00_26020 [Streptomyces cahuitamycinicus]